MKAQEKREDLLERPPLAPTNGMSMNTHGIKAQRLVDASTGHAHFIADVNRDVGYHFRCQAGIYLNRKRDLLAADVFNSRVRCPFHGDWIS
jgi:hypothetical protein